MNTSVSDPFGDKAFRSFHQEKIHPLLKSLEARRRALVAQAQTRAQIAAFLCLLIGIVLVALLVAKGLSSVLLIPLLAIGLVVHWSHGPKRSYHDRIKSEIFPAVVSFFGESFKYLPRGANPTKLQALKSLDLLPKHDSHTLDDYVSGVYKGVSVEFTELALTIRKDKKDVTVFDGMVLTLGLKRTLKSRILLRQDKGALGNFFRAAPMPRVRLEDPEFEKMFEVYGGDQIESRTVLTPRFMECLRSLAIRFGGQMECTMVGNKLIALLPTDEDYFAVRADLQVPVVLKDEIEGIRNDMELILELVDRLQLGEAAHL